MSHSNDMNDSQIQAWAAGVVVEQFEHCDQERIFTSLHRAPLRVRLLAICRICLGGTHNTDLVKQLLPTLSDLLRMHNDGRMSQPSTILYKVELAISASSLAWHLCNDRLYKESYSICQEAFKLCRELAPTHKRIHDFTLPLSLRPMAFSLQTFGRYEEAYAVSQKAVGLWREYAEDELANYAKHQAQERRPRIQVTGSLFERHYPLSLSPSEELLVGDPTEIAYRVGLKREGIPLSASTLGVFRVSLAQSLHEVSVSASKLGRYEEACAVGQEAVTAWRRLLEGDRQTYTGPFNLYRPPRFELPHTPGDTSGHYHELATVLNWVSFCLCWLGRNEEASIAIQEAVNIWQRILEESPEVLRSKLMLSLLRSSLILLELGRVEDAISTTAEFFILRQQGVKIPLDADLPILHIEMELVASELERLEKYDEAAFMRAEITLLDSSNSNESEDRHIATPTPNHDFIDVSTVDDLQPVPSSLPRVSPVPASAINPLNWFRRTASTPGTSNGFFWHSFKFFVPLALGVLISLFSRSPGDLQVRGGTLSGIPMD